MTIPLYHYPLCTSIKPIPEGTDQTGLSVQSELLYATHMFVGQKSPEVAQAQAETIVDTPATGSVRFWLKRGFNVGIIILRRGT